jgi:hypothetical protein
MQPALKAMEERGMAWRFGTDDPAALLARQGWKVDVKQPGEDGAKFNATRFPSQSGNSGSFFVVARQV